MSLTVLMPSCDWPRGSGMVNPNTKAAIRSVIDSGVPDLELWVGLDGEQPAIEKLIDQLNSPLIRVLHGAKTRSSGNHQRRRMMEALLSGSRRGLFAFHDDDDAYLPGCLSEMVRISEEKGLVPVLARHVRPLLDEIRTPEAVNYASGRTWKFDIPISFAASIFPVMEGMPLWPEEGGYYADLPYAHAFVDWFEKQGKEVMLYDRVVTRIRPADHMGSLVEEFHP